MINLNIILIAMFIVAIIVYCAFFHEKSLLFVLTLVWLILDIAIAGSNICFQIFLNGALNPIDPQLFEIISGLLTSVKVINIYVFFGIILLFYLRKNKEVKE